MEISKNNTENRVIDLAIYKKHYVLIKKLNVFIGKKDKKFICRLCLISYTSENMVTKHKQCNQKQITGIKPSSESHHYWKNHFYKHPSYFRVYVDFEADNEKVNFITGNKTTNIYEQNPVCNGYGIVSELENVPKIGYYKSTL